MTDISHLVVSVGQELKSCPGESFCLPFLSSLPAGCLWGSPTGRPDQGCRRPLQDAARTAWAPLRAVSVSSLQGQRLPQPDGPGEEAGRRVSSTSDQISGVTPSPVFHTLQKQLLRPAHSPREAKQAPSLEGTLAKGAVDIFVNFCENLSVFLYAYVYQRV